MSKRLSGKDAFESGLVDAIAPRDKLLSTARDWALDILDYRRPWVVSLYKNDRLEPLAEARIVLNLARSQAREQNPNLTHPLVCIDVIEEGIVAGPRSGLWKVCIEVPFYILVYCSSGRSNETRLIPNCGRKQRLCYNFDNRTLARL